MRRTALIVLALAVLAAAGCAVGFPAGVVYPSIAPGVGEPLLITHEFTFEGAPVSITVTVDGGLYAGASAAEKTVTRFGNARENDWIEDYYPAFVNEEHQESFFADVIAAFRAVRDARGLDADRYAELLTVFAQSLTYRTDPVDLSPKFPVETFVEGDGDCDDKTLLLGALLAREGYDVAILLFEPEEHVALGIRSATDGYAGTGYDFIETTAPAFIGMVPDSFAGGITLTSTPRVFRIDGGTAAFGAGAQVAAILDGRAQAIAAGQALASEVEAADSALAELERQVAAARAELDNLKSAGMIAEYNARIDAYNALVGSYNTAASARNALAERYNALSEVDRLVVDGLDDRVGTYQRVMAALD
ncbi:MAG: hypothetical protein U1E08_01075 [Coriobacteriia bacterium]|nr:hypothetical protein [Actinomycetota bacterium]MDZ4166278.1 hypothetical protein [Coriobacteriia bacterium]